MKNINKDVYQEKRYGKSQLLIVAIIVMLVSLAMLIGGIALFVNGCLSDGVINIIWKIVLGIILALFGGTLGWVSIMMLFTGISMIKVKDGNVKDVGNSGMGTVNILKCDKCGESLEEGSTFCPKCGTEVDGVIVCTCGEINSKENEFCKKCGKNLKQ